MPIPSSKPELNLLLLDNWMIRWKRFQSESDYAIEKRRASQRHRNYFLAGSTWAGIYLYTASPSTVARWFSAPHFFDIGVDATIKGNILKFLQSHRRYTPTGWMRTVCVVLPSYFLVAATEHMAEKGRWNAYIAQKTVFGEQARRLQNTGKIEDMLPINIKAPLPEKDSAIYAK